MARRQWWFIGVHRTSGSPTAANPLLPPTPPSRLVVSSIQIDSENEALLAALTKTLDDIPEDDVGLAAFPELDEGDTPSCDPASPAPLSAPPSPALERLLSPVSEVDELSMVRTVASGCCQVVAR